jgi:hypothetical protein
MRAFNLNIEVKQTLVGGVSWGTIIKEVAQEYEQPANGENEHQRQLLFKRQLQFPNCREREDRDTKVGPNINSGIRVPQPRSLSDPVRRVCERLRPALWSLIG